MTGAFKALALLGLAAGLTACDGNETVDVSQGINSLGSGFVAAFNADANDDPINPQDVDSMLTPTIEPFDPSASTS